MRVNENKERRKSFDFKANITILPEIIEDMDEDNDIHKNDSDTINDNLLIGGSNLPSIIVTDEIQHLNEDNNTKIKDLLHEDKDNDTTTSDTNVILEEDESGDDLNVRELIEDVEISYNAIEILIESEKKHSTVNISTPIKFPLRRYPASLTLDQSQSESKLLLNDSLEINESNIENNENV